VSQSSLPHLKATCAVASDDVLGEGPVWVADQRALYWLDIKGLKINRFDPVTRDRASWPTAFRIGSIAPRVGGGFVGGSEHGFVMIDATITRFEILANPEPHLPANRFNDGALDPAGRFWAGTMDDAEEQATGALYRLDADLSWSRHDGGYQVTNGPAFSPDGGLLYHTDSAARTIYRFRLGADGSLSDELVFAQFGEGDGYPDGMTVDREGCLWIAFWDGWCVRRLSPEGVRIAHLPMPVQRPTSCTFGGPDLDRLFVTSATIGLDDAARAAQPLAGGLFMATPGVSGVAMPPFAG
jgi:sugar lactone lactonase YvrE